MTPVLFWTWVAVSFAGAWYLTGVLRRYALARQLVDVPNVRSSHAVATPRGGGAAIVVVTTVALGWWSIASPDALPPGVVAAGLLVAAVGFIDDHGHLPPMVRLACHALAAVVAVMALGGAALGVGMAALGAIFIAWFVNLTNFMDGIDGLAGAQIVTVCAVGAALSAGLSPEAGHWFEPAVVAAAAAGFLIWNWPPARVFLGDVGSGYVGFMVAVLALRAAADAAPLGWSWVILSGVFVTDASVTLLTRAVRRQQLFHAHRSHAYQRLTRMWGTHLPVTRLVIGINLVWLAPMAALVAADRVDGLVGLAVACAPLLTGAVWLGAGRASADDGSGVAVPGDVSRDRVLPKR